MSNSVAATEGINESLVDLDEKIVVIYCDPISKWDQADPSNQGNGVSVSS